MRWVFDRLFASFGEQLEDHLSFHQAEILARHGWQDGSRVDLFADRERSADAIAEFAGGDEAQGYLNFCEESESIFNLLKESFIARPEPSLGNLVTAFGINPFKAMKKCSPSIRCGAGLERIFMILGCVSYLAVMRRIVVHHLIWHRQR